MAKYCSLTQVEDMAVGVIYQDLGFDEQSKFDKFVDSLVDRASRFIDRQTQRPDNFFNGGATITEYQDGKADTNSLTYSGTSRASRADKTRRTYFLEHAPVISVTSVYSNSNDVGETAAWAVITKYNLDSNTGRLVLGSSQAVSEGTGNLRAIYKAGYSTTPNDIQYAAEELVVNQLKYLVQQGMASKVRFAQPSIVEFSNPKIFDGGVTEKLGPYKKRRM